MIGSEFIRRAMASTDPRHAEGRKLLRELGLTEAPKACEHDWHYYGTVNGVPHYACQTCGEVRR